MTKKKLKLSKNKMIAGVCGGIAEYYNIHPLLVRGLFVIFAIGTLGAGAIIYLIALLIMMRS